jgi:hypothetical protein
MAGFTSPYSGGTDPTQTTGQDTTSGSSTIYSPLPTGTLADQGAPASQSSFVPTDGWYVFIACIGGVLVADTRAGPLAFGILTVALIYQLQLLLRGK